MALSGLEVIDPSALGAGKGRFPACPGFSFPGVVEFPGPEGSCLQLASGKSKANTRIGDMDLWFIFPERCGSWNSLLTVGDRMQKTGLLRSVCRPGSSRELGCPFIRQEQGLQQDTHAWGERGEGQAESWVSRVKCKAPEAGRFASSLPPAPVIGCVSEDLLQLGKFINHPIPIRDTRRLLPADLYPCSQGQ